MGSTCDDTMHGQCATWSRLTTLLPMVHLPMFTRIGSATGERYHLVECTRNERIDCAHSGCAHSDCALCALRLGAVDACRDCISLETMLEFMFLLIISISKTFQDIQAQYNTFDYIRLLSIAFEDIRVTRIYM